MMRELTNSIMEKPDKKYKPVEKCPKCGAPVTWDLLYHGPGADAFQEMCTQCTWVRKSHFTLDGCTIVEKP
jgi:hypothetical protein